MKPALALAWCALLTLLFGCLREERGKNAGLPLVASAGPVTCLPPASHYQWKQRRIA